MLVRHALCACAVALSSSVGGSLQAAEERPSTSGPQPVVAARPVVAAPAQSDKAKSLDLSPIEANIIQQTNAQRARYGLAALEVDSNLMQSARSHASWMARTASLVHTRQAVAENIAMGQPDPPGVLRSWMSSSGHRANILNRGHRRIGVAAYRTISGTIFWCQQFR